MIEGEKGRGNLHQDRKGKDRQWSHVEENTIRVRGKERDRREMQREH